MRTTANLAHIAQLIDGLISEPFALLGPHPMQVQDEARPLSAARAAPLTAVRAFLPSHQQAWVVDRNEHRRPMRKIHPAGVFEAICAELPAGNPTQYQIEAADRHGKTVKMHDPYAFPPLLTEYDLYLLNEGRHWQSYQRLGAQLRVVDGVAGVNFAVWAPNATSVSVRGSFNDWDPKRHPMRKHIPSGFWELFVPGVKVGAQYKFVIRYGHETLEKCDPYGFASECPPRTANIVADLSSYVWNDHEWMANRPQLQALDRPMSFYEVHLGSWRRPNGERWYNYREIAQPLVEYVQQQGYTHIELLPLAEHPLTASWGYQVTGFFACTARYGTPQDLMYLIDYCHQNGIGVVMDWVPAHFPRDGHGLARFDGTCLYEHADPRQGEHRDWGTLIFNYGRHEVRNFLISNALFWLDKYHIDGLRVDAVASMLYLDYSRKDGEWLPNCYGGRENLEAIAFIKELNEQAHLQYPGVLTIAEESTAWGGVSRPTYLGGLGFSLKWNMGWMNDTRRYMRHDPVHRKWHHDELTFSLIYAFHENFVLPLSHDEVVHGKGSLLDQMPGGGDLWQRFANLRLMFGYMWTHPGKKLLFMGGDIAQWNEWNYDGSLQWELLQWDTHRGVQKLVADLNRLLRQEPALHQLDFDWHGFEWVDCHNYEDSVLSYIRKARDPKDHLIVVCNFTPVVRHQHRLGVPEGAFYREILNTDSRYYGGSDVGNYPGRQAEPIGSHGRPYSIAITLPPLGMVVFKPQR